MAEAATAKTVLAGSDRWSCERADCLAWLSALPDDSVDLLFTSPPYEVARTYGIGFGLKGQAWVDWMVEVVRAASPKVRGLIAVVCEGQTRSYRYSATPFLLMADLHRAGFCLRKPVAFRRVGIPGSGGPDWLRNDWEPVVCVTRPGRLPWSDNTACGHPPKWAPGGEMSHRVTDGTRTNQWGKTGAKTRCGAKSPGNKPRSLPGHRPSHVVRSKRELKAGVEPKVLAAREEGMPPGTKLHTKHNGKEMRVQLYTPPVLANPGNVVTCNVGGGQMGHPVAHENEAPFPLELAEFFVLSFCPPGGLVIDPFLGSGTTCHAAVLHNRRFIGCDVRQSQVDLVARRMRSVTPALPGVADE